MSIKFGSEVIIKEHSSYEYSFRYNSHVYCARVCDLYGDMIHLIIERYDAAIRLVLMTDAIDVQSYNIEPDNIATIPYRAIVDYYIDFDVIMPKIQAIFDIFNDTVKQWQNVFA